MKYIDYINLTPKDQLMYRINTWLRNFGHNFVQFWIKLWHSIINLFKKIGRSFKKIGYAFAKGDIFTKLSFIFLGLSHIKRKQYIKGFLFLCIEALFIFYMVMIGGNAIVGLITLGTRPMMFGCALGSQNIYNIDLGGAASMDELRFLSSSAASLFCQTYAGNAQVVVYEGHKSQLLLLFGILCVIIMILFVAFYVSTVNSSIKVQEREEARIHNNTFFEDIKEYLDGKFYRTLLFLPVLGIAVFTLLPIFDMIMMAFTNFDRNHMEPKMFDWVGLSNFGSIFSMNSGNNFGYTFWNVLLWTLIWAFFATFLNYFLGMIVAMIINKKGIRFKGLWRTCLVLSIAIPSFVSLLAINKFLSQNGIVQGILYALGVLSGGETIQIWTSATSARIAIIVINIWVGIPYTVLSVSGILLNIPEDLYESAQIDGTSPFRTYTKITLPYVVFVTGPSLITQFVGNINNFNVIFFLSGGGPQTMEYANAGKTDLLVTWLYKLTVNQQNYSMGSVIGILVFIVCATLSLIAYRHTSAYKNEETFA